MTRKLSASLGVFSWLLALCFFTSSLFIFSHQDQKFKREELRYALPVEVKSHSISLRSDIFGHGFFGAHRDGGRVHKGIDILAPLRQPVLASKSGRVAFSGWGRGFGQYIEICHPDGLSTRYAHLHRLYVSTGDWVTAGEMIGACGKTGNASDPRIKTHLHFEIVSPGGALNPTRGLLDPTVSVKSA